ncbi:MAG: glycosyltransferase, partial [Halobacteriota archaeon]|nr:glycosyltransferase [Halobacteriota archaeon]
MILSFLYISIAFFIVPASVYLFYYAVTFKKGQNVPNLEKLDDSDLPKISIVIPAYNEEKVIENRIKNLGDVYPKDKFEVVLSNDGSTDRTEEIAKDTFE